MPVPVNTGVVTTEDRLADEKPVDMASKIAMLDVDNSQFMTILNRLPSRAATQIKVNWLEDQLFPNASRLATGVTAVGQTAFTVTTGEGVYFRAGDIVLVAETGEKVEVVSIATDVLTVVRSIGAVAAATATNLTDLVILGNAAAQGADTGVLKATDRVLGFNQTQIFRDPYGFTGTDAEISLYGADDPERETAKKAVEHKRHLEGAVWAGGRDFAAGPPPKSYMGGITEFVLTNVFLAVGTLSLAAFDPKITTILQRGSMNKVIFSAPKPAMALSNLLANNWIQARPDDNVYGAKVSGFVSGAYGERLPVIVKREWGVYQQSGRQLGGAMFVLDLDYIKRRPMRNRDTQLLSNRQLPGEDKVVFDYLTEMSLEVANEAAHGILYGITG